MTSVFEQAEQGLGERVAAAVAGAAEGRLAAGLGQALGVFDRDLRPAAVAVVDEATTLDGAPIVQGRLQGVEDA
jgi:hypothetical protein